MLFTQPKSHSIPRRARARASISGTQNFYAAPAQSDFTALNQKPAEAVLAEQKAAEQKMQMYVKGSR